MRKQIINLAVPNIISNISVPLLSIIDTAIAGHMSSAYSLGGVTLAATLVNFVVWLWGFLRMATTGFTAQAYGRADKKSQGRQLSVGTAIALVGGVVLIILSPLFSHILSFLGEGSPELLPEAKAYLSVAVWGLPAALLLYVYNAWFVGMQNTLIPMWVTIISNVLNIFFSFVFVYFADMGVEGIALGTVLAQYAAVLMLLIAFLHRHTELRQYCHWFDFPSQKELFSYIHIAKYLIVRTLLMGGINLFFVKTGSHYGETVVGSNTLLMQLFLTCSYFMDGFAYAGEALTGKYWGAKDKDTLRLMLKELFTLGAIVSSILAVVYWMGGEIILTALCNKPNILAQALKDQLWVVFVPIAAFASFLWDGIFVGMTQARSMTQAISLATAVFYIVYFIGASSLEATALWLAFLAYLSVRSLVSAYLGIKLIS